MNDRPPVLETRGLTVVYGLRGKGGPWRRPDEFAAVSDVNISILPGQTLGLVGESGSGKSTTARAICGLVPYQGQILFSGTEASRLGGGAQAARHRQMIFQDPYSSLDPLMTVGELVAEPLRLLEGRSTGQSERVQALLEAVRLPTTYAARLPSELSGGQRQRVAIARALATEPDMVICDEALSALDASTQGEVLAILRELRDQRGLSYLFIAHDLAVVRHLADQVAVMYLGNVVESGPTELIFRDPKHPYTQALLAAAPIPHPRLQRARRGTAMVRGEPPDPSRRPSGCPFHPRCPIAQDRCKTEFPRRTEALGRRVFCHVNGAGDPAHTRSASPENSGRTQVEGVA